MVQQDVSYANAVEKGENNYPGCYALCDGVGCFSLKAMQIKLLGQQKYDKTNIRRKVNFVQFVIVM